MIAKKKMCRQCLQLKPLSDYHKHSGAPDGKRTHCKFCATKLMRNYRKTGKTFINEFDGKDFKQLQAVLDNLTLALQKYGYTIYKRKLS